MKIIRAHKSRIDPTEEQLKTFELYAAGVRYVYNLANEQRQMYRKNDIRAPITYGKGKVCTAPTYFSQSADVKLLRQSSPGFLGKIPFDTLNFAIKDLDLAYQRAFANVKETGVFSPPKFRSAMKNKSFAIKIYSETCVEFLSSKKALLNVPRLGKVRLRGCKVFAGNPKCAVIKKEGDHWYAVIFCESEREVAPTKLPTVGIDCGVKVFAALSNGLTYAAPNAIGEVDDRLRKAQQKLSRQKKGSRKAERTKKRIQKLHARAANVRASHTHKTSATIATLFGKVIVEDLNLNNMTSSAKGTVDAPGKNVSQKAGLNRAILNQGIGMFVAQLNYKLNERGGELVKVNPAYTSQTCSECGHVDKASRRSQAEFVCTHCGHTENADINAAKNIYRRGTVDKKAGAYRAVEPAKRILSKRIGNGKHKQKPEVTRGR